MSAGPLWEALSLSWVEGVEDSCPLNWIWGDRQLLTHRHGVAFCAPDLGLDLSVLSSSRSWASASSKSIPPGQKAFEQLGGLNPCRIFHVIPKGTGNVCVPCVSELRWGLVCVLKMSPGLPQDHKDGSTDSKQPGRVPVGPRKHAFTVRILGEEGKLSVNY